MAKLIYEVNETGYQLILSYQDSQVILWQSSYYESLRKKTDLAEKLFECKMGKETAIPYPVAVSRNNEEEFSLLLKQNNGNFSLLLQLGAWRTNGFGSIVYPTGLEIVLYCGNVQEKALEKIKIAEQLFETICKHEPIVFTEAMTKIANLRDEIAALKSEKNLKKYELVCDKDYYNYTYTLSLRSSMGSITLAHNCNWKLMDEKIAEAEKIFGCKCIMIFKPDKVQSSVIAESRPDLTNFPKIAKYTKSEKVSSYPNPETEECLLELVSIINKQNLEIEELKKINSCPKEAKWILSKEQ